MPRKYSPEVRRQVIELARAGTRVAQLVATFAASEATIYNWLKQDRVDRGEAEGLSTDQALELAAARRRIRQLETELAVSRKVNEVFLDPIEEERVEVDVPVDMSLRPDPRRNWEWGSSIGMGLPPDDD